MRHVLRALAIVILCIAAPLAVHEVHAQCGNGIIEPGEECDDGNTISCDGCDSLCQPDSFYIVECIIYFDGDVNESGSISSADIIYCVNYVFKSGPEPLPHYANGDVNCDGLINSADIIHTVRQVFKGGPWSCDICNFSPIAPPSGNYCY